MNHHSGRCRASSGKPGGVEKVGKYRFLDFLRNSDVDRYEDSRDTIVDSCLEAWSSTVEEESRKRGRREG